MTLDSILDLLPQKPPFRFVDKVISYEPTQSLSSIFNASLKKDMVSNSRFIPPSILIEGLAQTAVLFTQLETNPLQPGEVPLLGSVRSNIMQSVSWDGMIQFIVKPLRLMTKSAVIEGKVYSDNVLVATMSIAIGIAKDQRNS